MTDPSKIEHAISRIRDETSFVGELLIDALGWPIDQPRTQLEEDCASYLIVRWKSSQPANTPIVEVLMVGQVMNRGISFSTRGYEVKE